MGVRENIRKQIARCGYGGSISKFAKDKGLSNSYLNEILNGKRRFNEDWLKKISEALGVEPWQLLSDQELVPYPQVREEHAQYILTSDRFENIKLFDDPLSLGPGNEISEIPPSDYLPFLKRYLPRGYKSDPDRIVAFPTAGISMRPTINPGSIVWIDRKDIQPKEGEIYAFWLADRNAVTVKRILKINKRYCIIDGDNKDAEDRKSEELRDFPMVIDCKENEDQGHPWPIRGRVIWVLNRFIEEPKR
ncbi:MAG: helix-turn-helix domain-containing protein [Acidobacteria bacterium]|nr:helix-turn-helix domain-containing protein [Acidobacteriota bacterium]